MVHFGPPLKVNNLRPIGGTISSQRHFEWLQKSVQLLMIYSMACILIIALFNYWVPVADRLISFRFFLLFHYCQSIKRTETIKEQNWIRLQFDKLKCFPIENAIDYEENMTTSWASLHSKYQLDLATACFNIYIRLRSVFDSDTAKTGSVCCASVFFAHSCWTKQFSFGMHKWLCVRSQRSQSQPTTRNNLDTRLCAPVDDLIRI